MDFIICRVNLGTGRSMANRGVQVIASIVLVGLTILGGYHYWRSNQSVSAKLILEEYQDFYHLEENRYLGDKGEGRLDLIQLDGDRPRVDQTYTIEAINGLQTFINTYPFSERVGECNNLIDEMRKKLEQKAFEEGKLYYDIKRYQASIQSFGNLLVDFPETAEAEQVRYLISRSAYLWASNSFREKQKERYELAIEKAQDYLDLFANGANNKEVENMLNNSREKLNSLNNDGHQKQSSRAGS